MEKGPVERCSIVYTKLTAIVRTIEPAQDALPMETIVATKHTAIVATIKPAQNALPMEKVVKLFRG